MFFWVVFVGCIVFAFAVGLVFGYHMRQNTKDSTPSASHNKPSPKFPSLEEVKSHLVSESGDKESPTTIHQHGDCMLNERKFLEAICKIVDPDGDLPLGAVIGLVEEKFTSTNAMPKLPELSECLSQLDFVDNDPVAKRVIEGVTVVYEFIARQLRQRTVGVNARLIKPKLSAM